MNKTVMLNVLNATSFDEGNVQGYRRGLIKNKKGEEATDMLEIKKHNVCKMSSRKLDILIDHYTKNKKR